MGARASGMAPSSRTKPSRTLEAVSRRSMMPVMVGPTGSRCGGRDSRPMAFATSSYEESVLGAGWENVIRTVL